VPVHTKSTGAVRTETRVAISKETLSILICPLCRTQLQLVPDGSGLKCGSCRRVYPLRDDIFVLLPEEATIPEE
jgi:uncharacterized protein YbaR (Trm112 family)